MIPFWGKPGDTLFPATMPSCTANEAEGDLGSGHLGGALSRKALRVAFWQKESVSRTKAQSCRQQGIANRKRAKKRLITLTTAHNISLNLVHRKQTTRATEPDSA
jgi:hypothetical protein